MEKLVLFDLATIIRAIFVRFVMNRISSVSVNQTSKVIVATNADQTFITSHFAKVHL